MSNRTLKFRAWDTLAKQFVYPDRGYQGHFILTLNGQFQNLQNGSGGDEYVVQQWTGMTDINKVEIYEGDILEIQRSERDNAFKKYSQVGVVEFRTGIFLFSPNGPDNENYYTIIGFHELFHYNEKHLGYYAPKIIGNIFENSELLNNELEKN
jgi:uncharacterized phage protein (TIGR01671 family)